MRIVSITLLMLLAWPAIAQETGPADGVDGAQSRDDDDSAGLAPAPEPTPEPTPSLPPPANERLLTARILVDRLARLDVTLRELSDRRNLEYDAEERMVLNGQVTEMQTQRETAEGDLERLMTGLDMVWLSEPPTDDFSLEEEVSDLLAPILQELKAATSRPRKIEQLRILVAHYEERQPRLQESLDGMTGLADKATSPAVRQAIRAVREGLVDRQRLLDEQLSIARHELAQLEAQRKSILDSGRDVALVFFRNRGRNLLAAFLALFLTIGFVRLVHRSFRSMFGAESDDVATLYHRVADLVGHLLALLGGLAAMLLVLYASGDWVLLTLAGIVLLGISLGARRGIPRVWEEIKLLLNLSTVRQGERVMYLGVPWRVARLNLLTRLENPAFPDAPLRLPVRQLFDLRSRPFAADEPWFPCADGDWVALPDDLFGQVKTISPEFVEVIIDDSVRTWPTIDFLAMAPANLSGGFRHVVRVTFDYMHQKEITTTIPSRLEGWLRERLTAEAGEHLLKLGVDYEAAMASSLDVRIDAEFSGALAADWRVIRRVIEGCVVDACNEYGWEIALPQLVVHRPPGAASS